MKAATDPIRVRAVRLATGVAGFSVFAASSVLRWQYGRFLGLGSAASLAVEAGRLDEAKRHATELLKLAETFRNDWNYGNAVHSGHVTLGRVYLKQGDTDAAGRELLLAGGTPGSPQLNSFGPNMTLARDLIAAGHPETVIEYLELCRACWCPADGSQGQRMSEERLNRWIEEIRSGQLPDFGPNLVY